MKAEYINPFLSALSTTFETMLGCTLQRGAIALKESPVQEHDFSGVIGLSGNAAGIVVLNLSEAVAVQATATMLMVEADKVTDSDVVDAVGELANLVAGAAKAKLEEFALSVSLPSVVTGKAHSVGFPSTVASISVPFTSAWGPLKLEVGLSMLGNSVAV